MGWYLSLPKVVLFAVLSLLLMLLPLFALEVSGEEEYTPSTPWMPPDDYVDPVMLKVRELKEQGLNDTQIIAELEKLGMGWNPETGATWIGTTLSPEEEAQLPVPTILAPSSSPLPTTTPTDPAFDATTENSSSPSVSTEALLIMTATIVLIPAVTIAIFRRKKRK